MLNAKIKYSILAVCILVVIVVTIWGIWIWQKATRAPTGAVPVTSTSSNIPSLPPVAPAVPLGSAAPSGAQPQVAQAGIEAFARSFVERYGSFSNQSNYENLEDLYPFMTESFRNQSEITVSRARRQQSGALPQYSGVTTRAVSVKDVTVRGERAELLIKTQRQNSGTNSGITYQDIELTLVKFEGQWKVDAVEWK